MDLKPIQQAALEMHAKRPCRLPGVSVLHSDCATPIDAVVYDPVICLILQGEKVVTSGDYSATVSTGDALLVSHDVPVVSKITTASRAKPYLAVVLSLDMAVARSVCALAGDRLPAASAARALSCHRADKRWCEPLMRYLQLRHDPLDVEVLGPLILQELVFRLVMSPIGATLRERLHPGSQAERIGKAIAGIRSGYRESLAVSDLAALSNMSTSSFHEHFKTVTGTTPLQYQKDLRLIEARTLLVGGRGSVATVAFDVGYESAAQFSREYARKYGVPPSADVPKARPVSPRRRSRSG